MDLYGRSGGHSTLSLKVRNTATPTQHHLTLPLLFVVEPFSIHLVGVTESGLTRLFTLSPPGAQAPNWSVQVQPKPTRHSSLSRPIFSAVLDISSARLCEPSTEGIQRITEEAGRPGGMFEQSVWVAASRTRIRIYAGPGGREIAGVDVGGKGGREIGWVDLVERHGEEISRFVM